MATSLLLLLVWSSVCWSLSPGFQVIQPPRRTLNADRSASISCKHTAPGGRVRDVRLYSRGELLCQRGQSRCNDTLLYQESADSFVFVLLNLGPEAAGRTFHCQLTLEIDHVDFTQRGEGTTLDQNEEPQTGVDGRGGLCPPGPLPPLLSDLVKWLLIGGLALLFLYGCVITHLYVRLQSRNRDAEDSTYVEMRKAPLPHNQHLDLYYM
ncbi:uncharacterized protein ACNS7B_023911 [Menidia menidia]